MWIILITFIATTINGLKIASYNTFNIFTNPIAADLASLQIPELAASDADIMCLQELFSPYQLQFYNSSLFTVYPYSFSALNIRPKSDFAVPRTSCTTDEISAFTSECPQCTAFYPDPSIAGCMAAFCPDTFAKVRLTECAWCFAFAPQLIPTNNITEAASFCGSAIDYSLDQTDGTMIISKLPIINSWSLELPAWLYFDKRVNIAQIDVCSETSDVDECTDSVIVACIHLHPTDYIDPVSTFVAADQAQKDANVSSHIDLNKYQIEYLLDDVLNDSVSPWNTNDDSILGVFIAGDFNVGQKWPVGYDNFQLFVDAGYKEFSNEVCTVCLDPSDEYYNILTLDESETWVIDPDSSRALDHVMIREDYLVNFEDETNFERLFLNEYYINGTNETVPLSDHWGVQLEVTTSITTAPEVTTSITTETPEVTTSTTTEPEVTTSTTFTTTAPKVTTSITGCAAVDIDGFLDNCSELYGDLQNEILRIETNITRHTSDISSNTADITQIETDHDGDITALQNAIQALKDEMDDKFGAIENLNAAHFAESDIDGFGKNEKGKHVFLIISMMSNFILMAFVCFMMKNMKKDQYEIVSSDDSSDENY